MMFSEFAAESMETEVVTASVELLLDLLHKKGIGLSDIRIEDELRVRFCTKGKDCGLLIEILEQRGYDYKLLRRYGVRSTLNKIIHRPVLLAGVVILLALTLYLPTRILFVTVEGNERISTGKILETAADCGIRFGASRRAVRSEAVKNELLYSLPDLKWTGVNTKGCVAVITVKERAKDWNVKEQVGTSNIVAVRDGIVDEVTVTRGTATCVPGQSVCRGEILVNGSTDCGRVVLHQRSEGEIYAFTNREFTAIYLAPIPKNHESEKLNKNIFVFLGKKLINLRKGSGNLGVGYGKLYKETYMHLPGGFQLPVCWQTVSWPDPVPVEEKLPVEALAHQYLWRNMVGGQILQGGIREISKDDSVLLDCAYYCREIIGKEVIEESLAEYEQRN